MEETVALPTLSPSRSGDFKSCPLRYRLRVIDRIPEPPSRDAARGTVVHLVLERLFDLPAATRTLPAAEAMVEAAWAACLEDEPDLAALFADDSGGEALHEWLGKARELLGAYFRVEDPARLEPWQREQHLELPLPEAGVMLHGYVDRIDKAADGRTRIVDYKTGRAPGVDFEARALFQLKFYALMLWRRDGELPDALRLIYLGNVVTVDYRPDAEELLRFERSLLALWTAIQKATATGDFRPRRSALCDWCAYQHLCPEFGGTTPPLPVAAAAALH